MGKIFSNGESNAHDNAHISGWNINQPEMGMHDGV